MEYLLPEEYESYGLSAKTAASLVASASALIDAHCRRKSLAVEQYTERRKVGRSGRVRLSYLPLAPLQGSTSAIVSMRGRYAGTSDCGELAREVMRAFSLPGTWVGLDVSNADVCAETGEIALGANALGLPIDEIEVSYTAGSEPMAEVVKHACAMIVRNAQATPALNVRGSSLDGMHMEYFSDSLLDADVKKLLASFVAQRVG